MKEHFDNLLISVPDLLNRRILDLGSGEGSFVLECARRGCEVVGLELNPRKVAKSRDKADQEGLKIEILEGVGETMPFEDEVFDFLNVGEVIEHVQDPKRVLEEMHRVMKPGGIAYISVHNRFGIYDMHFHIYFLGWMPRFLGERYVKFLGRGKDYQSMPDMQKISEMHYYTFSQFKRLANGAGFKVADQREEKIRRKFGDFISPILSFAYKVFLRPWCFSTFHILLRK